MKYTKREVNYSPGKPDAHCGICAHYRNNHTCNLVDGRIEPDMWCKKFERSLRDTIKSAAKAK